MSNQMNAGLEQMEQVRDLLFGTHMRTVEKRLDKLDKALERSMNRLRDDDLERHPLCRCWSVSELEISTARSTFTNLTSRCSIGLSYRDSRTIEKSNTSSAHRKPSG